MVVYTGLRSENGRPYYIEEAIPLSLTKLFELTVCTYYFPESQNNFPVHPLSSIILSITYVQCILLAKI
jgi:hypothetical protein